MEVEVLEPHGFCAGVSNALRKALDLAETELRPLYCLHELVHNGLVVAALKARGFVFVESIEEVPEGATVLFSAHGVSPEVRARAAARNLVVVDATCPFVDRVHRAARAFSEHGLPVVVIGNPAHAEVRGIIGEIARPFVYPDVPERGPIGVVSQTTMNADEVERIVAELRERFEVETTAEVCNATRDRQNVVRAFTGDALLVLGSHNSSNTRRLCEVASCRAFRASTMAEVRSLDFSGVSRLGLMSGASTPEDFFDVVRAYLEELANAPSSR